jgi:hypothetical protein
MSLPYLIKLNMGYIGIQLGVVARACACGLRRWWWTGAAPLEVLGSRVLRWRASKAEGSGLDGSSALRRAPLYPARGRAAGQDWSFFVSSASKAEAREEWRRVWLKLDRHRLPSIFSDCRFGDTITNHRDGNIGHCRIHARSGRLVERVVYVPQHAEWKCLSRTSGSRFAWMNVERICNHRNDLQVRSFTFTCVFVFYI